MRANDIIKAAEKIADEKKLKEEKKQSLLAKREEIKYFRSVNKYVSVQRRMANAMLLTSRNVLFATIF